MSSFINKYNKDYYGGGLMLVLGLAAACQGASYKVGSLIRMGPGFFPVALGVLLALTGAAILLGAKSAIKPGEDKQLPSEWRGWSCITLSLVAFVALGKYGGLLPATFAITFIAAMGDRKNTILSALMLAAAMSVIAVVVFWWALHMQFPLFRWG